MKKPRDPAEFVKESAPLTPAQESEVRRQVEAARGRSEREKGIAKAARAELERVERALDFYLEQVKPLPPLSIKGKPSKGLKQACPVFVASDWHVEEVVKAERVNGLNEYDPGIAERRAAQFFESALWLIDGHRSMAAIEDAVLAVIGDLITGWIHEECLSGNSMGPPEAARLAQGFLYAGIRRLLDKGRLRQLVVVCSRGNHGRITKRTFWNAPSRLSFEWLVYHALADRFSDDPRVRFVIEDGYHTYLPVYDKVIRFHHGDAVQYAGGVGGITIPLRKKIDRWNQGRRADLDVLGHFHQFFDGGTFVVNGSLIGYNGYAESIGASPETPQQAFFLMRAERGKSATAPVFVT